MPADAMDEPKDYLIAAAGPGSLECQVVVSTIWRYGSEMHWVSQALQLAVIVEPVGSLILESQPS
jgi:hypothetical protein